MTAASSGIGSALAEILYLHNAKVYVAARSEGKAAEAISEIKSRVPESKGKAAKAISEIKSRVPESKGKAAKAISEIKSRVPESKGSLIFLHLDLDDLTAIESTAEAFLRDNERLDVL